MLMRKSMFYKICFMLFFFSSQTLITQARTKQAATMSEVEWRGRTVPVKIDKARIFLLGLADNEAAIAQASTSCYVEFKSRMITLGVKALL